MKLSISEIGKLLLVVLLVGAGLLFAVCFWWNSRTIRRTEITIRQAVNEQLLKRKVDPISVVALPRASRVFGVPRDVTFEQHLFQTDEVAGRRPWGTVYGTFHRRSGEIEMNLESTHGKREYNLRAKLQPVR